ncbi:uncharacterized protein EURHEDRAFT_412760 [Aspergillus ruber CBS 135680]|uniref:Uncharacterized protein n=1 Tax=Aspergillus ruber (strain CBS 135680) TaxID=1388766 RepID=A0A017SD87_ASPRC|nr:uncharacterized protein EURHEDRAFT_412760 [Aspergillus ruber CBS 135680]EYE94917.1 hypothetical protein EURHEDRAFT_412760 [Aspergillus ruber CBS 135680]
MKKKKKKVERFSISGTRNTTRIRQKDTFKSAPFSPIATVPNQSADPICNSPGPTPSHVTTRSHARKDISFIQKMWIVWSRKCAVGYFGRRAKWVGWLGDQRENPEKWRGRSGQGRKRESTGARTYVSRQHSSPQIDKTSLAHSCRTTV